MDPRDKLCDSHLPTACRAAPEEGGKTAAHDSHTNVGAVSQRTEPAKLRSKWELTKISNTLSDQNS